MKDLIAKENDESVEEYLWRIGNKKMNNELTCRWDEIAMQVNSLFDLDFSESYWRKKYKRLASAYKQAKQDVLSEDDIDYDIFEQKMTVYLRDEKTEYRKYIRSEARQERFYNRLIEVIKVKEPPEIKHEYKISDSKTSLYVLLSDIHYGLSFDNVFAKYNENVAEDRILNYANEIVHIGKKTNCCQNALYVSFLCDLISGGIHPLIKLENQEDIVHQTIGISELLARFIEILASNFKEVYINSVSGNHSRIEPNKDHAPKGERLDVIVEWYCKATLSKFSNVHFVDSPDDTFAEFDIYNKKYLAIHGDYDKNYQKTISKIASALNKKIDYVVSGHLHIPHIIFDKMSLIQNGAVVTGGDEYTLKNRMFGPAYQLVLAVSENGVDAVYPVKLG